MPETSASFNLSAPLALATRAPSATASGFKRHVSVVVIVGFAKPPCNLRKGSDWPSQPEAGA